MLLNKRQREVIYKALIFSAYKYRQRGNVDKAVAVQTVMNEISGKLGVVPETFTKDEVDNIVNRITADSKKYQESAYHAGIQEGKKRAFAEIKELPEVKTGLAVGAVIDVNKCKKCEHNETCFVYKAISEVEATDNNPEGEGDTESQQGDVNKAEEVADTVNTQE